MKGDKQSDYDINNADVQRRLAELDSEFVSEEDTTEVPPVFDAKSKKPIIKYSAGKKFWLILVVGLFTALVAAWFLQPSRLAVLNFLGFKTDIAIAVSELESNGTVIRKFKVATGDQEFTSVDNNLLIQGQGFGRKTITVSKDGYKSASRQVVVDVDPWFGVFSQPSAVDDRNNFLFNLEPTGLAISFKVTDWLSGLPISDGLFSVGDVDSKSDSNGQVTVRYLPTTDKFKKVVAKFDSGKYLAKEFNLDIASEFITEQSFSFVPSGTHYFVAKTKNVFDILSSNLDGSGKKEVLKGSGQETTPPLFAISPDGKFAVIATAREAKKDLKGNSLQTLYLLELANSKLTTLDEGLLFNFFDWAGDKLVYSVNRYEEKSAEPLWSLRGVDIKNNKLVNLDLGKMAVWGVYCVGDQIVYNYKDSSDNQTQSILAVVSAKGDNRKDLAKNPTKALQTSLKKVSYQLESKWYEYNFELSQVADASQAPTAGVRYLATAGPDAKTFLLIDKIDNKTNLLSEVSGKRKLLTNTQGVEGPIRWLHDNIVTFRITTGATSSDYAISLDGGMPQKITETLAPVKIPNVADYIPVY